MQHRTVLVTGAGRGLGFASAVELERRGWHVIAAMRSPSEGLQRLKEAGVERVTAVALDVTDPESVRAGVEEVLATVGTPHVVVHNAGVSAAGPVEDTPEELWRQVFETNVFGPVRLTNALLPHFRAAGGGRIVLVSSVAGERGMPSAGVYGASKAAAGRWAEALAAEVGQFGIGVTVLVTGTFKTDILTATEFQQRPDTAYAGFREGVSAIEKVVNRFARPPAVFARHLADAVEDDRPFRRRPVGPEAVSMLVSRRLLPDAALHRAGRLMMRVPGPVAAHRRDGENR